MSGAPPRRGRSTWRRYREHIIIGIPPHVIIAGMPIVIIPFIISQQALIISICEASSGVILQTMPSFVISQVIFAIIIARIGPIIIGIIGMPPVEPIIGMGICIGPIIGMGIGIGPIIGCVMGIGIPPPIGPGIPPATIGMGIGIDIIMGMPIIGVAMGIICISGIIVGAAFISDLVSP